MRRCSAVEIFAFFVVVAVTLILAVGQRNEKAQYSVVEGTMATTSAAVKLVACYVTVPTKVVGETIAKDLVTRKLAACVNIIPSVTSVYAWKGDVQMDDELLLMIKTRSSLIPSIVSAVKKLHPYEVPEVISVPLGEGGLDAYLNWVRDSTLDQPLQDDVALPTTNAN